MANMVLSPIRNSAGTVEGLGTTTFTVGIAGPHRIGARATMVPTSGLIITINKNGSALATSPTISATEQALSLSAISQCAVGDILTVVLTSTGGNNDIIPNDVKTTVVIDLI